MLMTNFPTRKEIKINHEELILIEKMVFFNKNSIHVSNQEHTKDFLKHYIFEYLRGNFSLICTCFISMDLLSQTNLWNSSNIFLSLLKRIKYHCVTEERNNSIPFFILCHLFVKFSHSSWFNFHLLNMSQSSFSQRFWHTLQSFNFSLTH